MDSNTALNAAALANTITKLQTKLARQTNAVKETEQHIAAIQSLVDGLKTATPKK